MCSNTNPVTGKKETWLGCKGGFAICIRCCSVEGLRKHSSLARGEGSFLRYENLRRHSNQDEHKAAVRAWEQSLRDGGGDTTLSTFSAQAPSKPIAASARAIAVKTRDPAADRAAGCRAVIAARTLLETHGSFRSFETWRDAVRSETERQAFESSWHCKKLVETMASYERVLTFNLLKEGAAFRLEADALDRTYQVEIGTVLWSLPSALQDLPKHGVQAGWLQVLGPRGPWLVERIIGMREFPQGMDLDGKVAMLDESVRRACMNGLGGEVNTQLLQHVRRQMRAWCSDGADLHVPLAASATFPGLVFHAWDESHSAQKLCANALAHAGNEITITDKLLVTGKNPYSLAKFLGTSMVFRKTVGNAQIDNEIAFVKHFGWAPQRFASRARPYAREGRRWKVIFAAVSAEATGNDRDRRLLARMYLRELGGENSSRLVLGALLADLFAEHYSWVAEGDHSNPDATTAQSRADAFLERLDVLFNQSMILTLKDSYTGATLQFLQKTSYYDTGAGVQTIGIGDWNTEESARNILKQALGHVRVVVANMKEYMKVYRSEHSWIQAFAAFRLPSALLRGPPARKAQDEASLRRICKEAELPDEQSYRELLRLLPRAEKFHGEGCNPNAAWGRASAEWPEFQSVRRLVELFLIWKTSSGNLERRFRRFRELRCPERAKLLDVTVESCMLVEQAPPGKMLNQQEEVKRKYCHHVLKLHEKLSGKMHRRIRRIPRRDAGVPREPASGRLGPETEAAFGRKRAAAVADVVEASPSKRTRMLDNAPPGLASVAQEAGEEAKHNPPAASADVVSRVAKRAKGFDEQHLRGASAAAKGRAKREAKVVQSNTQPRYGRDMYLAPVRRPGLMLVLGTEAEARRKAQAMTFQLTSDPVDFVKEVVRIPRSKGKGHVVLAPPADTDFSVSAMIAAGLMGGYYATPKDFVNYARPPGIMYTEKYKSSKDSLHVAVSATVAEELPTLPPLLREIAQAPGSCLHFYLSARKLCKFFKRSSKAKSETVRRKLVERTCVLSKPADRETAGKKYKELYITPRSFLLKIDASIADVCPGCSQDS